MLLSLSRRLAPTCSQASKLRTLSNFKSLAHLSRQVTTTLSLQNRCVSASVGGASQSGRVSFEDKTHGERCVVIERSQASRSWVSKAMYSILSVGAALFAAFAAWPAFEAFLLPYTCSAAMRVPKTAPLVNVDLTPLQAQVQSEPCRLIILVGPGSSAVARHFIAQAARPAGIIDHNLNGFEQNYYEGFAFSHLGLSGLLLNTYIKAAMFVSSILSGRHPHTDSYLYLHNLNNNVRRALSTMSSEQPIILNDHVENLVELATVQGLMPETRALHRFSFMSMEASAGGSSSCGDATHIWTLDHASLLRYEGLRRPASRAAIIEVQEKKGIGFVLRERRPPCSLLQHYRRRLRGK